MKKELYFEEDGKINKEAIIFIHSNLLSNWVWKNQKNHFNNYHCIYLDLPEHGQSIFGDKFLIDETGEIVKDFIIEKLKNKKVHLVGIAIGGEIILYLLAKYPQLIETGIVTGVNLKPTINENSTNEQKASNKINQLLSCLKKTKIDILNKKHPNFIIKGYLAEYGLGKEYFNELKKSIKVSESNLISITRESLKFKIPHRNMNTKNQANLLILYGTKEYPKISKSARIIKDSFPESQVFSVYKAIHLWNIIDNVWFNEIINEFILNKTLNLNNKPYLKDVNKPHSKR
jgi:hypothetical protein